MDIWNNKSFPSTIIECHTVAGDVLSFFLLRSGWTLFGDIRIKTMNHIDRKWDTKNIYFRIIKCLSEMRRALLSLQRHIVWQWMQGFLSIDNISVSKVIKILSAIVCSWSILAVKQSLKFENFTCNAL